MCPRKRSIGVSFPKETQIGQEFSKSKTTKGCRVIVKQFQYEEQKDVFRTVSGVTCRCNTQNTVICHGSLSQPDSSGPLDLGTGSPATPTYT